MNFQTLWKTELAHFHGSWLKTFVYTKTHTHVHKGIHIQAHQYTPIYAHINTNTQKDMYVKKASAHTHKQNADTLMKQPAHVFTY